MRDYCNTEAVVAAGRQLVGPTAADIRTAMDTLSMQCRGAFARTKDGREVGLLDGTAAMFCALGAIAHATIRRHGLTRESKVHINMGDLPLEMIARLHDTGSRDKLMAALEKEAQRLEAIERYRPNPLIKLAGHDRHNRDSSDHRLCETCGAHVSIYNANEWLWAHRPESRNFDWWVACDNADCPHAEGAGVFQSMPDWVAS